jgi:hypothetical protein
MGSLGELVWQEKQKKDRSRRAVAELVPNPREFWGWDSRSDRFVRACVAICSNRFSKNLTVVLRFAQDVARSERQHHTASFDEEWRLALTKLASVSPADLRVCDVKELVGEGREDDATLDKDKGTELDWSKVDKW